MGKITLIEIIALIVSFFALVYGMASMVILKKRTRSINDGINKVLMDYEREQMEERLIVAAESMSSNPLRFTDMNHMILSNLDGELRLSNEVSNSSFFEDHGINLNDYMVEPGYIACLMPFVSSFKPKYETIKKACEDAGMHCHRSDDEFIIGDILKFTIEMILKSQVVIAVLDGRNANVYYEMGIAQSIGKPVIMVADDSKMREIPFDVQSNRMIFYKNHQQLRETLSKVLLKNVITKKDEP